MTNLAFATRNQPVLFALLPALLILGLLGCDNGGLTGTTLNGAETSEDEDVLFAGKYATTAPAMRTVYTDQSAYMAALRAAGYKSVKEGFEEDAAWGEVRTTVTGGQKTAPSITNRGVTWTSNNTKSGVTTGGGPARRGQWGFFTLPHGDPLNGIGDGWIMTHQDRFYAAGGWFETNTPYAEVVFFLNDNRTDSVSFDGLLLDSRHQFLGVIDSEGFSKIEVVETEWGGDEQKLLFADDFTFGVAADGGVDIAPLTEVVVRDGVTISGVLASLQASDDDYLLIEAALSASNTNFKTTTLIAAQSPHLTVSRLDLILEAGTDQNRVRAQVWLFNFNTKAWDLIDKYRFSTTDGVRTIEQVPNPNDYIHSKNGKVRMKVLSKIPFDGTTTAHTLRLDLVEVKVSP